MHTFIIAGFTGVFGFILGCWLYHSRNLVLENELASAEEIIANLAHDNVELGKHLITEQLKHEVAVFDWTTMSDSDRSSFVPVQRESSWYAAQGEVLKHIDQDAPSFKHDLPTNDVVDVLSYDQPPLPGMGDWRGQWATRPRTQTWNQR